MGHLITKRGRRRLSYGNQCVETYSAVYREDEWELIVDKAIKSLRQTAFGGTDT